MILAAAVDEETDETTAGITVELVGGIGVAVVDGGAGVTWAASCKAIAVAAVVKEELGVGVESMLVTVLIAVATGLVVGGNIDVARPVDEFEAVELSLRSSSSF